MTATQPSPSGTGVDSQKKPQVYSISVLFTGIGRFFRGFVPFIVFILINTILQALLILSNTPAGWSAVFILEMLASLVVFVVTFKGLHETALQAATGKPTLGSVFGALGRNLGLFALWCLAVWALVVVGFIVNQYLGWLVMAALSLVTLAAADGRGNALGANFRAIGSRFVRWLITVVIMGIVLVISFVLAAVNGFFVGGFLASILLWLYFGVLSAWFLAALATLYRSTWVGAAATEGQMGGSDS